MVYRRIRDSLDRTLALALAGLFLFIAANVFPFLAFKMQGNVTHTTLSTGVRSLYEQGTPIVASLVLLTTIVAPFLQISSLIFVLGPLRLGIRVPGQTRVFRLLRSGAALEHDGSLHHGDPGFAGEIARHGPDRARDRALVVRAADSRARGCDIVARRRVGLAAGWARSMTPISATSGVENLASCHDCGFVVALEGAAHHAETHCPRCRAAVHRRKPDSLNRTWALVITAAMLYVPANIFPVMRVISMGKAQEDTILSGAIYLLVHGMWPLALIVFFASVVVPLLKLFALTFLLISVQKGSSWRPVERTKLYHVVEAVGRWSMTDIYVVTILVALVSLGNLATIEAGMGAVYFAGVVVDDDARGGEFRSEADLGSGGGVQWLRAKRTRTARTRPPLAAFATPSSSSAAGHRWSGSSRSSRRWSAPGSPTTRFRSAALL